MSRCYFCRAEITDVTLSIEAGWLSPFLGHGPKDSEPVCAACTSARPQLGTDGGVGLAKHTRYADEAESAQRNCAWPQAALLWQAAGESCQDAQRRAYYARQAVWCRDMAQIASTAET